VFLGGDPQAESVMNVLGDSQKVDHFFHERKTKVTVLQQREASLITTSSSSGIRCNVTNTAMPSFIIVRF